VSPAVALTRDLVIGLGVGLFSGLFGVGGGIVLVPLLVLVMKISQKTAQATSLVVVPMGASVGALTYALGEKVAWWAVTPLILGGLVATFLGTWLVRKTPDRWLSVAFALVLVAAAIRLVWQGVSPEVSVLPELTAVVILGLVLSGFAMGALSSLMGVGGGIIVIPLLVWGFGFGQQLAAGTSLVVMIPLALVGAWRLSAGGLTQWPQGLRIGAGSALGALGGASLALASAEAPLQIAFAGVLVLAASQMLWKARA